MTLLSDRPTRRSARIHAAPARTPRKFRPDIEGLRAFAVVSVVLYHAHLGVRGGFVGVDVFFVISGFLITRQLAATVGVRGIRALPNFYARRMMRLLPAAAVVVAATVLAARIWAPLLQVRSVATDALYTTFYGLNYRLAVEGTQYLHQDDSVSPLQHFWSLGVEEQFYVVWPLLIMLAAWIGRRHRRALLAVALFALAVVSFWYSVTVTQHLASWAYFSLHTRAWELALGGLVALGAERLAGLPRLLGQWLALAGLVAVVASAFVYSDSTPYPGSAAALPVLGAAAVIAAGCGRARGVERLLAEPAMQCIGRASYSWYLWHWPMLVMAPMVLGHALTLSDRVGVVWLSLVAAIASYHLIENPARHAGRHTREGITTGILVSGAVAAVCALVITALPSLVGSGRAVTVARAATAGQGVIARMQQAIRDGVATQNAPSNLTPAPGIAAHDLPAADGTSCHANFVTVNQGRCVFGDAKGTHTAVIVGDSHADMWLPAFTAAARAAHWRVVDWTKSSCPIADLSVVNSSLNRPYTECDAWRPQVIKRIGALRPDLVFVSDAENVAGASVSDAQWSSATLRSMQALRSTSGATVELLQDVPVPAYDMPSCVADHLSTLQQCTFAVGHAYSFPSRHRALAAAAEADRFRVIDPLSWICDGTDAESRCPAVVGNLLVYRDDTHLTATFSAWLAPRVAPLLSAR